jgi:hypothetical protein
LKDCGEYKIEKCFTYWKPSSLGGIGEAVFDKQATREKKRQVS